MDLNYVLTLSDKVKLVTEPIEDKDILQNFKAKYGGVEVYKRAKTVWVGETPKVISLILFWTNLFFWLFDLFPVESCQQWRTEI